MKKVILLLGCILFLQSVNCLSQTNPCINSILYGKTISQQKFLECKAQLKIPGSASNEIFTTLGQALQKAPYVDLYDPVNSLGFVPSDFNYYDFENEPQALHRYRAIREIVKELLYFKHIETDAIISFIENCPDKALIQFILSNNRRFSPEYGTFIYSDLLITSNDYSLVASCVTMLLKINPEKHANLIADYYLKKFPDKLFTLIHHTFTNRTLIHLSQDKKDEIIENLFQQMEAKEPYYVYFDLIAIRDISGLDLTIDKKEFENPVDKQEIYRITKEKALKYYQENFNSKHEYRRINSKHEYRKSNLLKFNSLS